jgi:cardiolipin synthase
MKDFIFEHALFLFTIPLTVVFSTLILRARKPSGSTMAWLILVIVVPYLGIPLYLMMGGRKMPMGLDQKAKLLPLKIGKSYQPKTIDGVLRILAASGIPDPRENEGLTLLENGEVAFARYMTLIEQAKTTIFVTTFIFGNDTVGRALLAALASKAKSGVEVRVIVDSIGAVMTRHPSMLKFKSSNGQLAFFMPVLHVPFKGRSNLRNHRKLLIVDGEFAIIGGMNLAKEYMGPTPDIKRWTDLAIEVDGGSVADLTNVFLQDWAFAKHVPDEVVEVPAAIMARSAGHVAQVVPSGPDLAGDPLYDVLLNMIFSARREILIVTPYFIPDESLEKALDLAAKRGVKVSVLLPRKSNHLLADIARGSFIRQLMISGVQFHFYGKMIHAKAVLVDDSVGLLGSANFDMRSLLLNYELGLMIYDEPFLKSVRGWYETHVKSTTKDFPAAGFWRETLEGIGRVIGPMI